MSAEKHQLGLFNYRCWLLFFLFHPWIILGRCRFGNVRSESSGHASFWDLDLSSFPGLRRLAFFSINIGESCFLPRWANVFVADEMRACQCRPIWDLDLSSFPGLRRLAFFSINIGESCFLPRWANVFVADEMRACQCRPKHNLGSARTKNNVFVADEMRACQCRPKHNLARKTLADLHCKFFGNTEQKSFLYRKKNIIGQCF